MCRVSVTLVLQRLLLPTKEINNKEIERGSITTSDVSPTRPGFGPALVEGPGDRVTVTLTSSNERITVVSVE